MEEANEIAKELYLIKNAICSNFQAIIYFDEPFYTLTVFVELYLLWNISKIINDKIILIIGVNVILFYSLIDKKYPIFLFRARMFVKEMIEGILSAILVFIPKYKEVQKTQQN